MKASLHPGLRQVQPSAYRGFDAALKSGEPIWVLNNSQPKGLLVITVSDPLSGRAIPLQFERTSIPYCLTDMVPDSILAQSLDIRNFVRKGILKMITEEEAMKILNSEDGRREYERLEPSEFAQGSKKSARVQEMIDSTQLGRQTASNEDNYHNAVTAAKSAIQLHGKVMILENRHLAGELDLNGLMQELRIYASDFTEADYRYILNSQYPEEARALARKKVEAKEYADSAPAATPVTSEGNRFNDKDYEADYE